MAKTAFVVAALWFHLAPLPGAEVLDLEVSHQQGAYRIRLSGLLDAPPAAVYQRLTDFGQWQRLSPLITASSVIDSAAGVTRVHSEMKGCVFVFCRKVTEVVAVHTVASSLVSADIIPEQSDFRAGYFRWRLTPMSSGTWLRYEASITPAFWIPPLFGPPMVIRALGNDIETSVERLERFANTDDDGSENAPPPAAP